MAQVYFKRSVQLLWSPRQPEFLECFSHGNLSDVVQITKTEESQSKEDELGTRQSTGQTTHSFCKDNPPVSESTFERLTRSRSRMR